MTLVDNDGMDDLAANPPIPDCDASRIALNKATRKVLGWAENQFMNPYGTSDHFTWWRIIWKRLHDHQREEIIGLYTKYRLLGTD